MSVFALSWFLCFFVTSVPWEVSLRVIDCFFAFGSIIFLQGKGKGVGRKKREKETIKGKHRGKSTRKRKRKSRKEENCY